MIDSGSLINAAGHSAGDAASAESESVSGTGRLGVPMAATDPGELTHQVESSRGHSVSLVPHAAAGGTRLARPTTINTAADVSLIPASRSAVATVPSTGTKRVPASSAPMHAPA